MAESGRPKNNPASTPPPPAARPAATAVNIGKKPSGPIPIPPRASTATSAAPKILSPLPAAKPPSTSGYYGTVRPPGSSGLRPSAGVNSGVYSKTGHGAPPRGAGVAAGSFSKSGNASQARPLGKGVNSGVYTKAGNGAAPALRPPPARMPPPPSRTSARSMMALTCGRCGKVLDDNAVNSGRLICAECIEIEKKKEAGQRLTLKLAAAGGCLALVIAAILLPQQAMFIVLLGGLGMCVLGFIGAGWARVARLGLISAGLLALAGGAFGLSNLQERAAAQAAEDLLSSEAANVEKLLADDELLNAQRALDALSNRIRENPQQYNPSQALAKLKALQGEIDKWFESRYPGLPPEGRSLLQGLMRSFPDQPGKGRRIRSLKVDNKEVSLEFVSAVEGGVEKGGPPGSDPRVMEAKAVVLYVYDSLPYLSMVKAEFGTDAAGEFKAFGSVALPKEMAGSLRLGNVPPGFFSTK
ncbi:MAG TPA: hypothetical protein VEJ63_22000 [Planctomycetota bacterium]|nr:hypothetical protein [Planctomycetota bacterium]